MGTEKTPAFGSAIKTAFISAGLEKDFNNPAIKDSVKTLENTTATPRERLAAKGYILGHIQGGIEEYKGTPEYLKYAGLLTRIEEMLMVVR
jgi:hypothetical protein